MTTPDNDAGTELVVNPTLTMVGGRGTFVLHYCKREGGATTAEVSPNVAGALNRIRAGAACDDVFDAAALDWLRENAILTPSLGDHRYAPPSAREMSGTQVDDSRGFTIDDGWELWGPAVAPVSSTVHRGVPVLRLWAPSGVIVDEVAADVDAIAAFCEAKANGVDGLSVEARTRLVEIGVLCDPQSMTRLMLQTSRALGAARADWDANKRTAIRLVSPAEGAALKRYVRQRRSAGFLDGDFGVMGKQRSHVYDDANLKFLLARAAQWGSLITQTPLVGSYSFLSIYHPGGGLPAHRDKSHCPVSFSLCIDMDKSAHRDWPLRLVDTDGCASEVRWPEQHAAFFDGRRYEHRRDSMPGQTSAVFLVLHLVDDPNRSQPSAAEESDEQNASAHGAHVQKRGDA